MLQKLLVLGSLVGSALAGTNPAGLKFLEENKKKDGVITLPSGLQYKVLRQGTGKWHPKVSTPCECHYEGKLIDGTKFDSSYDRGSPTTFAPNQVIKGWTEAMQLMVDGDKWEMYIPSELGYGDNGSPPKIQGGDVLVFTMEIIKIKGTDLVKAVTCDPKTYEECNDKEVTFVDKWKAKGEDAQKKEKERLKRMYAEQVAATKASSVSSMNLKQQVWLENRLNILRKMVGEKDEL